MSQASRDENFVPTLLGVSSSDGTTPIPIYADPDSHALLVDIAGGSGTVTSVSVTTASGVSGTVATPTSTPAITITLGAISPTSVQSNTLTATTNNSINLGSGSYNTIQSYTPSNGSTATLDLSKGNLQHIQLATGSSATVIALSNGTTGQIFTTRIKQSAVGSGTVAWFTTISWAGGSAPTLTTTANKADTLGFEITGSNTYDGYVVAQNI